MLGRQEREGLSLQKRALVLESGLNRVALQAEMQRLRAATSWATGLSREFTPWLAVLAPLASLFMARGFRRSRSWLSRVITLAKWGAPIYRLWKSFYRGRKEAGAEKLAA